MVYNRFFSFKTNTVIPNIDRSIDPPIEILTGKITICYTWGGHSLFFFKHEDAVKPKVSNKCTEYSDTILLHSQLSVMSLQFSSFFNFDFNTPIILEP
mmetsp:Transcript_40353/g.78927  ORF Transcript_40353/g.78927 Transcript_40353/m.78927 type:complete len:98 (-) Transcript_40353:187-480(-)